MITSNGIVEGTTVEVTLTGHGVEQFATPRLVGRRLLPADTDFLVELHSSEDVMMLSGGTRSKATTEPFVQSNVAHWRHYQFGLYILSLADNPDDPIGRAGIRWDRSANEGPVVDLSVVLAKPHWGHGIGTEALEALISIGDDLNLPLAAVCDTDHSAALRVLEKVGFDRHSHFEQQSQSLVRYVWPPDQPPPGRVVAPTDGRPG